MKKTILAVMLSALCVMNASAQKKTDFEGSVTYDINFDGSGLPPEAMAMLKGAETTTYIKGDKRRVDMNMPMQSTSAIMDSKVKQIITLMDFGGQKYLIRMNEADIKKEEKSAPDLDIKYTDETKEIAGYKCKKAEVSLKTKDGKEDLVNVYYTEEIPSSDMKSAYKGLKGFPLEYTVTQGGVKMTFTAKSISKDKVDDSKFEVPKDGGYKETTIEDFQKEMMKMGAGGQ